MQRLNFFVLALLFSIQISTAQETREWDLRQCIDYALQNNLQLRQTALNIQNNEVSLMQSRMSRLPNLNASASHGYNFGRSIDPFTNQFTTDVVRSNNFGLTTSVPLFNGFQIRNTIKQNELNLQASQQDVEQAKNDLQLNIAGAYLNILLNQELLANARLQNQNTEAEIERTRKLIEAGVLPEANIYDLLSQQASNKQQITSAENSLLLAELALKQLLQLPAEDSLKISKPELPELSDQVLIPAPQEVYQIAEGNQPNVKSADLNIESAALAIDIAEGSRYPTVSLNGSAFTGYSSAQEQFFQGDGTFRNVTVPIGYLASDPSQLVLSEQEVPNGEIVDFDFTRQLQEAFRQNIGVSVQIPIFNRYQVEASVQNAKINLERSRLNAEIIRNQLRQTIEQAYADVRAAKATYTATEERVRALQETLAVTERRFRAGASNAVDYNLAQNQLNAAQTDLLRAKYDFIFRQKILDFYQGKEITLE